MTLRNRFPMPPTALMGAVLMLVAVPHIACPADPFPKPPVIQPSVDFRRDIYTRYSLVEGVVHDSRHPEVIYDVVNQKLRLPLGERAL